MKILLTNDDGIHAEGFAALRRIAAQLSDDVWVCAPEQEQSGASRGLTLSFPLRARQLDARTWALAGTPTDCVLLAVSELMPAPPDLVLSGVNRGWNIADDVTYSGTVAGALQAMALGVPGIALSQSIVRGSGYESGPEHFEVAEAFGPGLVHRLTEIGWPKDVVLNVNFPVGPVEGVKAVEVTTQGVRDVHELKTERRTDLRGRAYYWMGFSSSRSDPPEGTDLRAILDGRISVTPLHVDLTHRPTVHDLKQVLGGVPPRHVKSEA